jgi:hypothetical protein
MTRRLIVVVLLLVATGALAPSAFAGDSILVNGGGTGSLSATGTPPFSQFGMGVRILGGGTAARHFNCLMSGRSAFPGFQLVAVRGGAASGTATTTTASFNGLGTLLYNFSDGNGETQEADVTFSGT